jgi:hypothetical protein
MISSSANSHNDDNTWRLPMGVAALFSVISFILGCVSTNMALNNEAQINKLQQKSNNIKDSTLICQYGDVLGGDVVFPSEDGEGGYQIVGDLHGHITWKEVCASCIYIYKLCARTLNIITHQYVIQ